MLAAARDDVLSAFTAMPDHEAARAQWRAAMAARLDPIGAKVAPTMTPDQAARWREAVTDALSDLPPKVALTAAKLALHRPMNFPNEVDGAIRSIAEEITARRRMAADMLDRLMMDLAQPAGSLLAAPEPDVPAAPEERERVNAYLRRIGLRTRFADDGSTYLEAEQALGGENVDGGGPSA